MYSRRSTGSRERRNAESVNDASPNNIDQQQYQQQQREVRNIVNQSTSGNKNESASQQYEPWVPPHRRTQSSSERATQDRKRLRELKVDDDFEKLKREMGM